MNQQPDKLFHEKLRGYQKPAPGNAWDRVAANLDRPHHANIWWKAAAAVLILAVSAALLFVSIKTEQTQPIAQRLPPGQRNQMPAPAVRIPDSVIATPSEKQPRKPKVKRASGNEKVTANPTQHEKMEPELRNAEVREDPALAESMPPANTGERGALAGDSAFHITRTTKEVVPRMTIIFTAAEVNEKYLEKKALADATPDDKKSSSFRKLLEKAYDLKINQDPLGDLRQKKNEILALNFKTGRDAN